MDKEDIFDKIIKARLKNRELNFKHFMGNMIASEVTDDYAVLTRCKCKDCKDFFTESKVIFYFDKDEIDDMVIKHLLQGQLKNNKKLLTDITIDFSTLIKDKEPIKACTDQEAKDMIIEYAKAVSGMLDITTLVEITNIDSIKLYVLIEELKKEGRIKVNS